MAGTSETETSSPPTNEHLSVWDAISLIIGIIIGASIYQASPEIFRNVTNAETGMIAWFLGGAVSMIGALCYAELASAYRTAGGDYTYLTKAYGPRIGFFFAWAELSVIRTGGSIAFMAYVFANYAEQFCPLGPSSKLIYAASGIVLLTAINAVGVRPGRHVQNLLTSANIIGLIGIFVIGVVIFCFPTPRLESQQQTSVEVTTAIAQIGSQPTIGTVAVSSSILPEILHPSFALAMVLVFYAYGGWNEAAFIASEVKNPRKNVRRALIWGTLIVTLLYLLVNFAYLTALGYHGVCRSNAIAGDLFSIPFGEWGRRGISILVMISALGSVHGLLFTGMRLYGTFGSDHKIFAWLAGKGDQPQVARGSLFAQAAFSLLLVFVVEMAGEWREFLASVAKYLGMEVSTDFRDRGGIYRLVTCTAPVFWLFFCLTGCSLFILRYKDPHIERPYRVPLYPWLPMLFAFSCLFMFYRSAAYAIDEEPAEAIVVLFLIGLGFPLMLFSGKESEEASESSGG